MPIHIQEIAQNNEEELLNWILKNIHNSKLGYVSEDEMYVLLETDLVDQISGESIGKIVYTSKNSEKAELLDIDLVLKNENIQSLDFVERLPKSSQRNEYYLAEIDNGCRFLLETVNRYKIEEEILHTKQNVSLSLFPFETAFFDNMEDINKSLGIKEEDIFRIDEHFVNPMSLFDQTDETYSFLIGKVLDFKEVIFDVEGNEFRFVIVYLDTGIGIVPAAFNKFVVDSNLLKKDKYITMYTDIKADFIKD